MISWVSFPVDTKPTRTHAKYRNGFNEVAIPNVILEQGKQSRDKSKLSLYFMWIGVSSVSTGPRDQNPKNQRIDFWNTSRKNALSAKCENQLPPTENVDHRNPAYVKSSRVHSAEQLDDGFYRG